MRRCGVAVLAVLAFAPAARAADAAVPCGVTASAAAGAAPLNATFTAACASSSYTWDFGDGSQATGQTVQHAFTAGAYVLQLTTDAGAEAVPQITSISLRVTAPAYCPSYFLRGFAVHGYPDVPPYPASHGCTRIPMWIAQTVYEEIPDGSAVYVYAVAPAASVVHSVSRDISAP
jgi:PKD domain/L,D-transpeptidase catalytic domain